MGVAMSSPSTALSTEMAGVIMPSPYRSAAPKMPSSTSGQRSVVLRILIGVARAVSARMPPSPWLSARRHEGDVLAGDHQNQRPEHQGRHAHDVCGRRFNGMRAVKALAQRIQRRRADVPVNDSEGGHRQGQQVSTARWPRTRCGVALEAVRRWTGGCREPGGRCRSSVVGQWYVTCAAAQHQTDRA